MKIGKAEILERRIREDTSNEYLYYVHYEGCKYYFLIFRFFLIINLTS